MGRVDVSLEETSEGETGRRDRSSEKVTESLAEGPKSGQRGDTQQLYFLFSSYYQAKQLYDGCRD